MQLAFVHIPQMFSSYAAVLEDRSHMGENLFHCAQCRQEFKIPVRASMCAPTFVFCPNCAKPFRFGCSNDDNVWVPHGHIAPRSMSLRLDAYKDLVKLTVRGRGFLPFDHNHETGKYWIEQRYREEIRFDIKTRRTTWLCTVGGRQEMRLELCDPIEIPTFAANSILRYLYSHFSIRRSRAEVSALLRTLRETVQKKLEKRVRHKVSSLFCSTGSAPGWLLLPIANIAYRIVFTDAPNLPHLWRSLNTMGAHAAETACRFPADIDLNVIRRAKSTVAGLIEVGNLPNTRSIRRTLGADPFALDRLIFLHRLFSRSDLAMQALPFFENSRGRGHGKHGMDVRLSRLKDMYDEVDILRMLRSTDPSTVNDTLGMLCGLGDESRAALYRDPPPIGDLHDILVLLHRREMCPDYTFDNDLAPIRRRLAMQFDRVQFFLPKHSKTLQKAGEKLHNCVSSYAQRVRDGETNIVLMSDARGKLIACIEVANGRILQAKLDRNQPVAQNAEINNEIVTWAEQVGVRYDACPDVRPIQQADEVAEQATA